MKDGKNYNDFIYVGSNGQRMDVSKSGVANGKACAPGMPSATSNPNCPQSGLKQECLKDLQDKCKQSGLADLTSSPTLDSGVPSACDTSLADTTTVLNNCVKFVTDNLMQGLNLDPNAITNIDSQLANSTSTRLRYLQTKDYIATKDPSANITTFDDVKVTAADVTVDNVSTADATSALNNNSQFVGFSLLLAFALTILL
jgi:hypothetical protein